MLNLTYKSLLSFFLFSLFLLPAVHANEINLFDGLIKIRTGSSSNNTNNYHKDHGHYEIIDGRVVWVEDKPDRHNRHIIDAEPEKWVLMTRIHNRDFDWVIIPASDTHKIAQYRKRGFERSMTGRKESCYKMGKKKEHMWKKQYKYWQ